jgi:hypothetical protein
MNGGPVRAGRAAIRRNRDGAIFGPDAGRAAASKRLSGIAPPHFETAGRTFYVVREASRRNRAGSRQRCAVHAGLTNIASGSSGGGPRTHLVRLVGSPRSGTEKKAPAITDWWHVARPEPTPEVGAGESKLCSGGWVKCAITRREKGALQDAARRGADLD